MKSTDDVRSEQPDLRQVPPAKVPALNGRALRANALYAHSRPGAGRAAARNSDTDREEMASIQTNWAYGKGLGGSYRDGSNLVGSAIVASFNSAI
jgi:hypothetical protein